VCSGRNGCQLQKIRYEKTMSKSKCESIEPTVPQSNKREYFADSKVESMVEKSKKNKSCIACPVHSVSYERHATRQKRECKLFCDCVCVCVCTVQEAQPDSGSPLWTSSQDSSWDSTSLLLNT
jgi:hypothetical protein